MTAERFARIRRRRVRSLAALPASVFAVVVAITIVLTVISHSVYSRNESRLLHLRVRTASSLLTATLPDRQTLLASAAALADATGGDRAHFFRLVGPNLAQAQLTNVSLWKGGDIGAGPIGIVGNKPKLLSEPRTERRLFAHVPGGKIEVIALLGGADPRLGFAYRLADDRDRYIAYGENAVPRSRRSRFESTPAFSQMNYAIYFGPRAESRQLVVANAPQPLGGRTASITVPLGTSSLTLVMSPKTPLGGRLSADLPWIILIGGICLAAIAAAVSLRLIRRRRDAELMADRLEVTAAENRRLYAEQRGIAQTLQHALLPDALPTLPGLETGARYEAGERGMEIGGDWYDLIGFDDDRLLLVVGDVSGRGLRAATTMAALRYAIRAYAAQRDTPEVILTKLSGLVSVAQDGQLATVLCVLVDRAAGSLTVTTAGHLPPLLLDGEGSRYVECPVGLPIGVDSGVVYRSATIATPPAGTLLAFTDGLVERRGESIDDGLERLRRAADRYDGNLPEMLSTLVTELHDGPNEDDTAIVGLRWRT